MRTVRLNTNDPAPLLPTSETLLAIARLIEAGEVRPTIQRIFALHEAAQAHQLSQSGHGRGRIVLRIREQTS